MTHLDDAAVPAKHTDSVNLKWSWIAVVSTILMILSLGALVLVATLQRVDALATIALALAVLSFVIQIGLFVADAWQRSQSEVRANQVNLESKSLLAEMKETSRATNELLNRQFDTVLRSLIETTEKTVANAKVGGADLRGRLDRELRRVISGEADGRPAKEMTDQDRAVLASYSAELSDDEKRRAQKIINELPGPSVTALVKFARDDVSSRKAVGSAPGYFAGMVPGMTLLQEEGLLEPGETPPELRNPLLDGQEFFVLSDEGRTLARYLLGPEWMNTEGLD